MIGVPFVAAESRVRAAVLGLGGAEVSAASAARITVPVEFLVQWDDERVPRTQSLELFDALASAEKTLHANPGKHGEVPTFETDSTLRFFARHLGASVSDGSRRGLFRDPQVVRGMDPRWSQRPDEQSRR